MKRKPDTQLVELSGRSWLASELMHAGIEVARPERDRGVDLIAYVDRDARIGEFIACPYSNESSNWRGLQPSPKVRQISGFGSCLRLGAGESVPHEMLCTMLSGT